MRFEIFESRRLRIKLTEIQEIKEYQLILKSTKVEERIYFSDCSDRYYLTVQFENGKLLGIIQVDELPEAGGKKVANIKISVPNNIWKQKYGEEILNEFIKCCKNRKLYTKIYLHPKDSIMIAYKKKNEIKQGYVIV